MVSFSKNGVNVNYKKEHLELKNNPCRRFDPWQ
jgi:hypothetical protein